MTYAQSRAPRSARAPLLAANVAPEVTYYHSDATGNLVAMTDSSGAVVWRADVQPFGQGTASSSAHPLRFVGQPRETDIGDQDGLYQLGARFYDPLTGRFLSPDPRPLTDVPRDQPQAFDLYAYGYDNPYRYMDPSGRAPSVDLIRDVKQVLQVILDLGVLSPVGQARLKALMVGLDNSGVRVWEGGLKVATSKVDAAVGAYEAVHAGGLEALETKLAQYVKDGVIRGNAVRGGFVRVKLLPIIAAVALLAYGGSEALSKEDLSSLAGALAEAGIQLTDFGVIYEIWKEAFAGENGIFSFNQFLRENPCWSNLPCPQTDTQTDTAQGGP
jgi:RHS repeat-associated protein